MDHHGVADVTDAALERDLEAALAVDPSPEFVAGVRMRVERERERAAASSPWRWRLAAAVALVAVIGFVVGMSRQERARMARDESLVQRQPTAAPGAQDIHLGTLGAVAQDNTGQIFELAPTTAFRKTVSRRKRPSAAVREPKVLLAADETRALRQLFSNVQKGLIDLSSLPEVGAVSAALQPPGEIAFPPITFAPIALQTAEEGERQ